MLKNNSNIKSIYLIHSIDNNLYKIGVSSDVQRRIRNLQTANPVKLSIVHQFETNYAHKIEKILHRRYMHLKKEGEWFELDDSCVDIFMSECKKFEDNLKYLEDAGNRFF